MVFPIIYIAVKNARTSVARSLEKLRILKFFLLSLLFAPQLAKLSSGNPSYHGPGVAGSRWIADPDPAQLGPSSVDNDQQPPGNTSTLPYWHQFPSTVSSSCHVLILSPQTKCDAVHVLNTRFTLRSFHLRVTRPMFGETVNRRRARATVACALARRRTRRHWPSAPVLANQDEEEEEEERPVTTVRPCLGSSRRTTHRRVVDATAASGRRLLLLDSIRQRREQEIRLFRLQAMK